MSNAQEAQAPTPLVLERTIPLPRVLGRIDHLAADVQRQRIFVAELGNGSVDAVDLSKGEVRRIEGLKEPQGLAYLPDRNELVIASGGDGTVRFFDANSLAAVGSLTLGDDADNVRVDPKTGEVAVGYGSGGLAVVDPARRSLVRTIALPAHPEGFQIDDADQKAFVNLPDAHSIAVVDLEKGRLSATFVASHRANYPMALNQSSRLVVVYRSPPRLAVVDASSGAAREDLPACADADDTFFDDERHRIYVSCGSGEIDVFEQHGPGYRETGHVATRPGARTSLFVPALDRLFVAARANSTGSDATLLVFRPIP